MWHMLKTPEASLVVGVVEVPGSTFFGVWWGGRWGFREHSYITGSKQVVCHFLCFLGCRIQKEHNKVNTTNNF